VISQELLDAVQSKQADRARARRDKFFLANEVLGYDFQECHAELFANYIQYTPETAWAAQCEIKDRMVLWSRGHYKTTSVVVEIIQAILNFPNIRILIMQGSLNVTKTLLKQIMSHFSGQALGSRLNVLFPEFCGDKMQLHGTQMQFTTCARTDGRLAQATVTVASPKSCKTGQHYEMGFFDDLMNDQNFRNPKLVQRVKDDFDLAQALIDPGGYRFVSGTRYAFGDLYETIARGNTKSGKWVISIKDCWTDESSSLPDLQKVPRFPRFTKKNGEQGGFTREELLQMQLDNPANFACQYLNRVLATTQQAYSKELLDGGCVAAADAPALSQAILVIDVASSENPTADDSVICAGKIDTMGCGYLCDMRGDQWTPNDLALNVIDMVLRHRPAKVLLEKSAAGMIFKPLLELMARLKNVFIPVEFIHVDNRPDAKNMRVVSLAGVIRRGRFKFFKGLSKWDRLVEQACEFPKGRYGHDDYIDTAALLNIELAKEIMTLPIRKPIKNPILAMMADTNNDYIRQMTDEPQIDVTDQTGLD
jgi:hypothetical protein